RHLEGKAILYADTMTESMQKAMAETSRRRAKQEAYNRENNITPQSIVKAVDMQLVKIIEADYVTIPMEEVSGEISSEEQLAKTIAQLEAQMREAAKKFEFERAAALRDRIRDLKQRDLGLVAAQTAALAASVATEEENTGVRAAVATVTGQNDPGDPSASSQPAASAAAASAPPVRRRTRRR
ncbi:MAG TPA: UvrB/UvrC motif-containing protein, partial [Candidatus Acidoferrum sp.]|nr:UvrB/UvrC motif-containing protein [Candidatus Acidoferrum sp.]